MFNHQDSDAQDLVQTLPGTSDGPDRVGAVKQLVVLLHGMASTGAEILRLSSALKDLFPDARFIAPDAPVQLDNGKGNTWFDPERQKIGLFHDDLNQASYMLNKRIDEELERYGLLDSDVVILGYSQGGSVALHAGLHRSEPVSGVLSIAGPLLEAATLPAEMTASPDVCLIHGEQDGVVPIAQMWRAVDRLMHLNVHVESHAIPGLGHDINNDAAKHAAIFIAHCFHRNPNAKKAQHGLNKVLDLASRLTVKIEDAVFGTF